jgi:hypothetical protein
MAEQMSLQAYPQWLALSGFSRQPMTSLSPSVAVLTTKAPWEGPIRTRRTLARITEHTGTLCGGGYRSELFVTEGCVVSWCLVVKDPGSEECQDR